MKIIRVCIFFAFINFISACGGGGDSGGGSTTPLKQNSLPVLILSTTSIDLNENTSAEIGVSFSDSDGDAVTITISSTTIADISYNSNSKKILVSANSVETNSSATFNVEATDSKGGKVSLSVTLNVFDINLPPTIEIGDNITSYTLEEGSSIDVFFNVNDDDEVANLDIVSSSENLKVIHIENEQILQFDAELINEDENVIVTITAIDSKGSSSSLVLTFLIQDVIANEPPVLVFLDEEVTGKPTEYYMAEGTRFAIPFRVDDPDTPLEDLEFSFDSVRDDYSSNSDIQFEFNVNKEKQLLEIIAGTSIDSQTHFYILKLNVFDGKNMDSKDFSMRVRDMSIPLNLILEKTSLYVVSGEPSVMNFEIYSSNNDNITIEDITYMNDIDIEENPLDFNVNKEDGTITFTAKEISKDRIVPVTFTVSDNNLNSRGSSINVIFKTQLSELEQSLISKVNRIKKYFEFTNEQDEIIKYLSEIYISQSFYGENNPTKTYEDVLAEIYTFTGESRYKQRDHASYISYLYSIEGKYTYLFSPDDSSSETNIESQIASLDVYEQIAVDADRYTELHRDATNFLELTNLSAKFTVFDNEKLEELPNGKYSRYVGNLKYGSYVNGIWTFSEQYKYFVPPLSKYLKMELN